MDWNIFWAATAVFVTVFLIAEIIIKQREGEDD